MPLSTFVREHFGLCSIMPGKARIESMVAEPNSDSDPATLTAAGYQFTTGALNFTNPANRPWQRGYSLLNQLPADTWLRVDTNLWEHFPGPANSPVNYDRFQNALIDSLMFRGGYSSTANGLRLLFVTMPAVWERNFGFDDLWTPVVPGPLAGRDRYRPAPEAWPYLRQHLQSYVRAANNQFVWRLTNGCTVTADGSQLSRLQFQLGNEPGAGHPGGSFFQDLGDWKGIGALLQATTQNLSWSSDNNFRSWLSNPVPNPLVGPAFSFIGHGTSAYVGNGRYDDQPDGSYDPERMPYNFQYSFTLAPATNELVSYRREMFGPNNNFTWAQNLRSRAVHFTSPNLMWSRYPHLPYEERNRFLIAVPNARAGRWETATEYAQRWVSELEKVLRLYSSLEMPFASTKVDITECYIPNSSMRVRPYDFASVPNPPTTLAQARDLGRYLWRYPATEIAVAPPPTRLEVLTAIRAELYNRFIAAQPGDPLTHLGRIFWWGGYDYRPRYQTGLQPGSEENRYQPFSNYNAVAYNPFLDLRLSRAEVAALFTVNQ